jgi:uncharacterized protein YcnI
MPISSDEFKKGYTESTLKASIDRLLSDCTVRTQVEIQMALNADLSFTKPSDTIGWKMLDAAITVLSFGKLLDSMVSEGKLETRYVETANGSETYYIKKSCIR